MITVRRAEPADADAAVNLLRRSLTELCVDHHHGDADVLTEWLANKTPQHFLSWLANKDFFCVVAEADDRLAGVGAVHRNGKIALCYLMPGTQRQGIGTAIYSALEAQARTWGLRVLKLESTVSARAFYERCGFRPVGVAGAAVGTSPPYQYEKRLEVQPHTDAQLQ
jgi:GNAT superfamily N-acetyltransferase